MTGNSSLLLSQVISHDNSEVGALNFQQFSMDFQALDNQTNLTISSLDAENSVCGIALDDFSMVEIE